MFRWETLGEAFRHNFVSKEIGRLDENNPERIHLGNNGYGYHLCPGLLVFWSHADFYEEGGNSVNIGDMVYYLYTDKYDKEIKFVASVIAVEAEGIHIRVGRFNVLSSKFETFESTVPIDKLSPRLIPSSCESELSGDPSS
jgi:hypothetical protein